MRKRFGAGIFNFPNPVSDAIIHAKRENGHDKNCKNRGCISAKNAKSPHAAARREAAMGSPADNGEKCKTGALRNETLRFCSNYSITGICFPGNTGIGFVAQICLYSCSPFGSRE